MLNTICCPSTFLTPSSLLPSISLLSSSGPKLMFVPAFQPFLSNTQICFSFPPPLHPSSKSNTHSLASTVSTRENSRWGRAVSPYVQWPTLSRAPKLPGSVIMGSTQGSLLFLKELFQTFTTYSSSSHRIEIPGISCSQSIRFTCKTLYQLQG